MSSHPDSTAVSLFQWSEERKTEQFINKYQVLDGKVKINPFPPFAQHLCKKYLSQIFKFSKSDSGFNSETPPVQLHIIDPNPHCRDSCAFQVSCLNKSQKSLKIQKKNMSGGILHCCVWNCPLQKISKAAPAFETVRICMPTNPEADGSVFESSNLNICERLLDRDNQCSSVAAWNGRCKSKGSCRARKVDLAGQLSWMQIHTSSKTH